MNIFSHEISNSGDFFDYRYEFRKEFGNDIDFYTDDVEVIDSNTNRAIKGIYLESSTWRQITIKLLSYFNIPNDYVESDIDTFINDFIEYLKGDDYTQVSLDDFANMTIPPDPDGLDTCRYIYAIKNHHIVFGYVAAIDPNEWCSFNDESCYSQWYYTLNLDKHEFAKHYYHVNYFDFLNDLEGTEYEMSEEDFEQSNGRTCIYFNSIKDLLEDANIHDINITQYNI